MNIFQHYTFIVSHSSIWNYNLCTIQFNYYIYLYIIFNINSNLINLHHKHINIATHTHLVFGIRCFDRNTFWMFNFSSDINFLKAPCSLIWIHQILTLPVMVVRLSTKCQEEIPCTFIWKIKAKFDIKRGGLR